MGDLNAIPRNEPMWDADLFWPPLGIVGVGSAFSQAASGRFSGISVANAWSANLGAATNDMQRYQNALAAQFSMGGGGTSERWGGGLAGIPYLRRNALTGSFKFPSWRRVYMWEFTFAWNVDQANTIASGIAIEPSNGTAPGWIGLGNAGMAIVRNGIGVWEYRSYVNGAFREILPLAWPVPLTEYATVLFMLTSATGGGDAHFFLRVNNVNMLGTAGRSFGTANLLPNYDSPGVTANAASFVPHVRGGDGVVGGVLYLSQVRFRAGRFDPDGFEV